jgi:hypothetical protein
MQSHTRLYSALVSLGCIFLSQIQGCSSTTTPQLDANFGSAVRAASEAQRLNPAEPLSVDATPGLDAKAAVNAIERYQDSFKTPPKTFEVINIGGAASSQ